MTRAELEKLTNDELIEMAAKAGFSWEIKVKWSPEDALTRSGRELAVRVTAHHADGRICLSSESPITSVAVRGVALQILGDDSVPPSDPAFGVYHPVPTYDVPVSD